jgi:hypothetical protein
VRHRSAASIHLRRERGGIGARRRQSIGKRAVDGAEVINEETIEVFCPIRRVQILEREAEGGCSMEDRLIRPGADEAAPVRKTDYFTCERGRGDSGTTE